MIPEGWVAATAWGATLLTWIDAPVGRCGHNAGEFVTPASWSRIGCGMKPNADPSLGFELLTFADAVRLADEIDPALAAAARLRGQEELHQDLWDLPLVWDLITAP